MITKFLKAKHWQLFVLGYVVPFLAQTALMMYYTFSLFSYDFVEGIEPNEYILENQEAFFKDLFGIFRLAIPIIFLSMLIPFGWMWSVSTGLKNKIPEGVTLKIKNFKGFFIYLVIYLLVILILASIFFNYLSDLEFLKNLENEPENVIIGFVISILAIIPFHFFAVFCIFYSMFFTAKMFKTIELQRAVEFKDFVGEFFLIWFFPIGVWILQPKINKMVENPDSLIIKEN